MSETFDKILSSTPINKVSARQLGRGEHWEPKIKKADTYRTWDAPPKMRQIVDVHGTIAGILGLKFGRFTVIGLVDDPTLSKKKNSSWVVRCVCGAYELRKARAIRNPANADDRCLRCQKLQHIQDQDRSCGRRA